METRFDPEAIRRARGKLSRPRLAALMAEHGREINPQTIWRWESGITSPSADDLPALAAALDTTPSAFFSSDCRNEDSPLPDSESTPAA